MSNITKSFEWDEPIPFNSNLPTQAFPSRCFPAVLRDYVDAVAESLQVPIDMVGVSVLAVLATCIQKKFVVAGKEDWIEPLNLYTLVVAAPSERKSGVLRAVTGILEKKESSFAGGSERQLFVDDCTPEILMSIMEKNDEKVAIISSESGIFDTMNGRYNPKTSLDIFLKAYSGDSCRVHRVGRKSEKLNNPALSIILMAQPGVVKNIFINEVFSARGLLGRFLYSYPESMVGHRNIQSKSIEPPVQEKYEQTIEKLLCIVGEGETIQLSENARKTSDRFAQMLERRLIKDLQPLADWAGKYHGTILRIAGLLHVVEHKEFSAEHEIEKKTFDNALRIGQYFLQQAKKVYMQGYDSCFTKRTIRLFEMMKEIGKDEFTLTELTRKTRGSFNNSMQANCIEALIEHKFIHREKQKGHDYGKCKTVFFINPQLL